MIDKADFREWKAVIHGKQVLSSLATLTISDRQARNERISQLGMNGKRATCDRCMETCHCVQVILYKLVCSTVRPSHWSVSQRNEHTHFRFICMTRIQDTGNV